eukprot:TRINITY_DN66017_c9_g5_i1.p1 TRINITY_DN66017_c9_g5~~TRINITY_DN66017_c9_g5_i1.p1  ORF type:complete len:278 (+),score=112.33 TRINITY_DN66017_c9_g5_i1:1-834(+)
MKLIGLTGGIASGKSTVARRLEALGAVVISGDALGHQAYRPGSKAYAELVYAFGPTVVSDDEEGTIDRRALGSIVFSDPAQLERLNGIVWPVIKQMFLDRVEQLRQDEEQVEESKSKSKSKSETVVVFEAAVLIEAGWQDIVDEVWVVHAPLDVACRRLMERNKLSHDEANKRIRSQMPPEERNRHADVAILNTGDLDHMLLQVDAAFKGQAKGRQQQQQSQQQEQQRQRGSTRSSAWLGVFGVVALVAVYKWFVSSSPSTTQSSAPPPPPSSSLNS